MKLASAANVEPPAYFLLKELGYSIKVQLENGNELWIAQKDGNDFIGSGPLELLGLVKLFEARGGNWQVSDEQIDEFTQKYC